MMIKLIITYQASSSSSHCAAQSPKLTRVTGSSPCFKTIRVNTFLILFCFFCILFIILHLFHHGQTNQYLQIVFFLYFFIVFLSVNHNLTISPRSDQEYNSFHRQPWFYLLVNSGGLSASASDLVSAFGPCPLWTRWHHTLDGAHFDKSYLQGRFCICSPRFQYQG